MSGHSEKLSQLDEELVAYLDGELDDAATQRVEETLSRDATARAQVDRMMKTWDLLDMLPQTEASEDFTEKTLTSIQVAETQQSTASGRGWSRASLRRWGQRAALLAALCLFAVVGFETTYSWLPRESDELVEELPLIENLHLYSEVDNVEFLQELQASGLFDEENTIPNP